MEYFVFTEICFQREHKKILRYVITDIRIQTYKKQNSNFISIVYISEEKRKRLEKYQQLLILILEMVILSIVTYTTSNMGYFRNQEINSDLINACQGHAISSCNSSQGKKKEFSLVFIASSQPLFQEGSSVILQLLFIHTSSLQLPPVCLPKNILDIVRCTEKNVNFRMRQIWV